MEDFNLDDLEIDTSSIEATRFIPVVPEPIEVAPITSHLSKPLSEDRKGVESCLRNEKVIVRSLHKDSGLINDPSHPGYGGMLDGSQITYTVPYIGRGKTYANVLTNDEKTFLEEIMGLEHNRLSVHKKENNYWDNYTVTLFKGDNLFDLSVPDDYIKYKVLLANKDYIASSLSALQDSYKETYKFVIIRTAEETQMATKSLNITMQAYVEFGKIQSEPDVLRLVLETVGGKPIANNTKLETLIADAARLIQADPTLFVKTAQDTYLRTKVLIRKAIDAGIVARRGDYLYLKSDDSPLSRQGKNPTLSEAAEFLNLPSNQDLKLAIEARVSNNI